MRCFGQIEKPMRGVSSFFRFLGGLCALLGVLAPMDSEAQDTLRLSLDSAVRLALRQNPDAVVAERSVRQAEYAAKEKWSPLMPKVSSSASYSRSLKKMVMFLPEGSPMGDVLEIGADNSYDAGVTATLPLIAPAAWHNVGIGRVDRRIAEEELRQARVNIAAEVKLAYIQLLLARTSLQVMEQSVESAEATSKNVSQMAKQGVTADYDNNRAQVQVYKLRPSLMQAQQGVETAEKNLRVLLALPEGAPLAIAASLEEVADQLSPAALVPESQLVEGNTNLRILGLQREKLVVQYRTVRDSYWPTLAAFFNYKVQTQANHFRFEDYHWVQTSMLGLQLSFDIFDGLAKCRQQQQLRIGADRLATQQDYLTQRLEVKAALARQQLRQSQSLMLATRKAVEIAERGVTIANTRYTSGAGTILEVTDAQMAQTQARLAYNQAVYDYLRAYFEYQQVMGVE